MAQPRYVTICGGTGGAGTTSLAVNLAACFTRLGLGRVLLVDAGLPVPGDASMLSGVETPRALAHLASIAHSIAPTLFETYLSRSPAGVSIINLCADAVDEAAVTHFLLHRLIALADMLFDVVVIDLAGTGQALVQPLLDRSDSVVVVSPPTPAGLVRTRRMIAALRAGQVPGESLALCLNRVVDADLVSPRRLEQDLEVRCAALIPDDATAMERALVAGRAVVDVSPLAPSAQAIEQLARELGAASHARHAQPPASERRVQGQGDDAQRQAMKVRVHRRLVDEVDLRKADVAYLADPVKLQELRGRVEGTLVTLLDQEAGELTDRSDRRRLLKELLDEALGLGPLEDLLADPTVTEIMVNRHDCVYVERAGRLERVPVAFAGADQVRGIIERIVSPLGRRIDEKVPMVDARLADGSRVNAVIPPLSLSGPALTIRKFSRAVLGVKDLLAAGTLSPQMSLLLDAAVRARLNIVISGGTGSGKTTLLNALASFVPATERIVTIEDAAELRLPQEHVVGLEGRPANIEGEGAITIRDLVRNALRMRPDRIVVGECRGGEALDMLQAMNTGHDGSLTTVHANSASDALGRLETLALMAGLDLPARAIREQIASAIHLVVHQARFRDGSRRITRITEVGRLEAGEFQTRDLFVFRQSGIALAGTIQGAFVPTGHRPAFLEAFANDGIHVPKEIFVAQTA